MAFFKCHESVNAVPAFVDFELLHHIYVPVNPELAKEYESRVSEHYHELIRDFVKELGIKDPVILVHPNTPEAAMLELIREKSQFFDISYVSGYSDLPEGTARLMPTAGWSTLTKAGVAVAGLL